MESSVLSSKYGEYEMIHNRNVYLYTGLDRNGFSLASHNKDTREFKLRTERRFRNITGIYTVSNELYIKTGKVEV